MKHILIAIIMAAGVSFDGLSQGILLNAGDSYSYQFESLPFDGYFTFGTPQAYFYLALSPSKLGSNGALRFEIFEDTPAGPPLFSRTVTASSGMSDMSCTVPNAWADVQGSIRLTMVSGSVSISVFSLQCITAAGPSGFGFYGDRIYPVPEPSAFTLLSLGCIAVVVLRQNSLKTNMPPNQSATPNGGPAMRPGNSEAGGGPPSVS
jgi:hypothetical protein